MKLNKFIAELKRISRKVTDPQYIKVVMADNIQVVSPILKGKSIFITDIKK
jgi:hypothetical protein